MQLRALLTVRSSPLVAFHASHLLLNNVLIIFFIIFIFSTIAQIPTKACILEIFQCIEKQHRLAVHV